ncbi:hypothetical protein MKX03_014432 [Papaver bracteatum]|nr:hypothetical protein MKX03_014432 [Papaver bracteatum]
MGGNKITNLNFPDGIALGENSISRDDDLEEPRNRIPTPFVLRFNNLSYSINIHKPMRVHRMLSMNNATRVINTSSNQQLLLNDISGEAREGESFAILGPSGSGKTTLIDALANKISRDSLRGSVTMNGETLDPGVLKTISAYVMQDDLLFPRLTVEETLLFSAEFRLPHSFSKSKKMARVQTVIDDLGLRNVAKTLIGDEGHRRISGGERRRVSIGVEIIHDPILMCLDEPTSGLDSSSAFMVAKLLQRIARTGRIVIMTVHQPSSRVIGLETVYYGTPPNLSVFLLDFGHPITENEETTEFMLDLYSNLEGAPGGTKSIHSNGSDLLSLKEAIYHTGVNGVRRTSSKFANSFSVEIIVLMKRSVINSKRTPEIFLIQIAGSIASSSVLASTFWHPDKTERGILERLGFFVFVVTTIFFGCTDALGVFHQERYIFMRETAYNAYRRSSYVLYHSIMVIPSLLVLSILFSSITFSAVSLDSGFSGFSFYFLAIFLSSWAANSLVSLISGLVSQVVMGYTVTMTLIDRIPPYWIWFHYISVMKYPFQALILNEFDKPDLCLVAAEPTKLCVVTGLDIIRKLDANDLSKWNCLCITLALGVFYRILFYLALLFGKKNKRK